MRAQQEDDSTVLGSTQGLKMARATLPIDVILRIYEFLWFRDVKIYLEASNRDEVTVQKMLHFLLNVMLKKLESPFTQSSRLFAAEAIRYDVFHFVSKMPPWPSRLVSAS